MQQRDAACTPKRWMVCTAVVVVLIATTLSCGDGSDETTQPVIRLAENPWTGSRVDVAVAAILLTEELGFRVEITPIDEFAQWEPIASGALHACMEVWPSGHAADIETYIENARSIDDAGPLGVVGKIGWYVPTYVVDQHPELATWTGLQDPAAAALFRTPATGSHGQFLAGDPTWVQYDEEIIRNLALNLEVVFAGTEEALLAQLADAYEGGRPLLFYFWTPHAAHRRFDLTEIRLPPYSAACYATAESGGVDCDYPADTLFKIVWPGLATYAPEAHEFLEKFNYTTADQTEMLAYVDVDGATPEAAARRWIADHEDVWRVWLPADR